MSHDASLIVGDEVLDTVGERLEDVSGVVDIREHLFQLCEGWVLPSASSDTHKQQAAICPRLGHGRDVGEQRVDDVLQFTSLARVPRELLLDDARSHEIDAACLAEPKQLPERIELLYAKVAFGEPDDYARIEIRTSYGRGFGSGPRDRTRRVDRDVSLVVLLDVPRLFPDRSRLGPKGSCG